MNQPLAYVHPGAKIAKNVVIEPFTTIHNNVTIGDGTWIGSNVTIMEGARIGKNCNIFPGADNFFAGTITHENRRYRIINPIDVFENYIFVRCLHGESHGEGYTLKGGE